jgi:multiple sugar transport system permease protein
LDMQTEVQSRMKEGFRSLRLSESSFAFLLNAPTVLLILLLVAYPIVYSIWLSLHSYHLARPGRFPFVVLSNYLKVLSSPEFWDAAKITAIFAFFSIIGVVILGTLLALILNESFPGRGVLRALILLPWAMPPVVNGLMWVWIFDGRLGAFNGLLYSLGIIDSYRIWLSNPVTSLPIVIFAYIWNRVPFSAIVILAALQAIPLELYDAAKVDRAGRLQTFRHVTLPWLWQAITIVLILQTMTAMRVFDEIYMMTGGGPGSATTVLAWLTYRTAFLALDFGLGNTYAVIISIITTILVIVYVATLGHRGEIRI